MWNWIVAIQNYKLTPEELQDLQNRKLRRILRQAYEQVPFYRKRFRSANLTPDDIKNTDDLRRLPTITRGEIVSEWNSIIANGNGDAYIQRLTSGTTGKPLRILRDSKSVDRHFGFGLRNYFILGIMPWFKAARIIRLGPDGHRNNAESTRGNSIHKKIKKAVIGPWLPILKVPRSRTLSFQQNVAEVAPRLLQYRPDLLTCRPSYLMALVDWLEENGKKLTVRKVLCEAEYLSQNSRKTIERAFGGDVYNLYGTNEFGWLGSECRQHSMHIFSDSYVFEVLKDGEPVSPGERGEVIITGLDNEKMPLIRYEQGDIAILENGTSCQCGSSYPRLRTIEGRKNDGLVLPGGIRIPPGEIISYAESVAGLKRYQVIQESANRIMVRTTEKDEKASATLVAYLRKLCGSDFTVDVQFEPEDSFLRFSGKNRPVISQIG